MAQTTLNARRLLPQLLYLVNRSLNNRAQFALEASQVGGQSLVADIDGFEDEGGEFAVVAKLRDLPTACASVVLSARLVDHPLTPGALQPFKVVFRVHAAGVTNQTQGF